MKVELNIPMWVLDDISYEIESGLTSECQDCDECWDGDTIIINSHCFNSLLSKRLVEAYHLRDADVMVQNLFFDHLKTFKGYK
jgi:hypothetical protein